MHHRRLALLPAAILRITALAAAVSAASAVNAQHAFPPAPLPPAEPWQPVEQVKTYAISGTTGIGLYQSIGARGPAAGVGQAIALTSFKLTWTRDYRPQPDGACVLAVAKPKLVITYTLPKAPKGLDAGTSAAWQRFIAGVEAHERVHGE